MAIIELSIPARRRELVPGFSVGRVLPFAKRRNLGPFVFLDHMGPLELPPGRGMDIGAHPHIGLATVTYLFAGRVVHRDSTGAVQTIEPGDVNWMSAGRGIAHSERTPDDARRLGGPVHGLQSWVALPLAAEQSEPAFFHHPAASLPELAFEGGSLRVIAGSEQGLRSPVAIASPLVYAELRMQDGATFTFSAEHEQRGAYVIEGALQTDDGQLASAGALAVFEPGRALVLRASGPTHAMLLGGAPLDAPRFIDWNFVASSRERIEQAKRDWTEGRFPLVPGEPDRIPLPG
ncbi:pirin family protein [Nannocystaceae bacterium ST9]